MLLNSVLPDRYSSLADVNITAFTWNSVNHANLFSWVNSVYSLGRTSCDLSVVSDLKTAPTYALL